MTEPHIPEWVDPSLVFQHRDDPSRCYLVGNSHTFPGRMSAYHADSGRGISVSKNEVLDSSPEVNAWIDGFLAGAEPPPHHAIEDEAAWFEACEYFRNVGDLERPNESATTAEAAAIKAAAQRVSNQREFAEFLVRLSVALRPRLMGWTPPDAASILETWAASLDAEASEFDFGLEKPVQFEAERSQFAQSLARVWGDN